MNITDITKAAGAHRRRKRVGRGEASGMGKTSGRGTKGAGSRTGWKQRLLFEGGAMPLFRRLPKRGFSNVVFATRYQVVNLRDIDRRFDAGAHVTAASLKAAGLVHESDEPVKILADGGLTKALTIEAQRFSAEAEKKIAAAGGTVKKLGPQPKKKFVKRPPEPKAEAAGPGGKAKGKGGGTKPEGGKPKVKAERGEGEKPEKGGKEAKSGGESKPETGPTTD